MRLPHNHPESASLLDMPPGCPLHVMDVKGSPSLRSKLYSMGILPGAELELCRQACGRGSVCVRVRQCSLVLDDSMAQAIFCSPVHAHHHRRHKQHGWFWQGKDKSCPQPDDAKASSECGCKAEQCPQKTDTSSRFQ